MNKTQLLSAIRLDLQKEQDAITTYTEQVSRINNSKVKKVLTSIANEERVHVGELTELLNIIVHEEQFAEQGEKEVKQTLKLPENTHTHDKERPYKNHVVVRHRKSHSSVSKH